MNLFTSGTVNEVAVVKETMTAMYDHQVIIRAMVAEEDRHSLQAVLAAIEDGKTRREKVIVITSIPDVAQVGRVHG